MKIFIDQLRRVQIIRFVLPFILFFVVAFYETWEHILIKGEFYFDIHLTSEVFFFGVLGPTAVFAVLTYIVQLLKEHIENAENLENLNQTLEEKVVERTTELEERNQELAVAYQDLKKLDQLKSDFVSLVSHELRGPLTTLNGGIELALDTIEEMPPESRRIFEVMAQETENLTSFVQTILDVSRLEAGKISINAGPVALSPLLQRIIDLVFAGKDREIQLDDPGNLSPILADEIYLEKIISNLLTNAEKYSPEDKPIHISNKKVNGHMEITITDFGPGIPATVQPLVFERFHRLERGDKINTKGWGLGLYFAKELAKIQGGNLEVKSPAHPGQSAPGAAFILKMPLCKEMIDDG